MPRRLVEMTFNVTYDPSRTDSEKLAEAFTLLLDFEEELEADHGPVVIEPVYLSDIVSDDAEG